VGDHAYRTGREVPAVVREYHIDRAVIARIDDRVIAISSVAFPAEEAPGKNGDDPLPG